MFYRNAISKGVRCENVLNKNKKNIEKKISPFYSIQFKLSSRSALFLLLQRNDINLEGCAITCQERGFKH